MKNLNFVTIITAIAIFILGIFVGIFYGNFSESTDLSAGFDETIIHGEDRVEIESIIKEYVELMDAAYEDGDFGKVYNFHSSELFRQTISPQVFDNFVKNPIMKLSFDNISKVEVNEIRAVTGDVVVARLIIQTNLGDISTIDFSLGKNEEEWQIVNFQTYVIDLQSTTLADLQNQGANQVYAE